MHLKQHEKKKQENLDYFRIVHKLMINSMTYWRSGHINVTLVLFADKLSWILRLKFPPNTIT